MNKQFLNLCVWSIMLSCIVSCSRNNNVSINQKNFEVKSNIHSYDTINSFRDFFTDIQFIPLENNKNCMLSSVRKL